MFFSSSSESQGILGIYIQHCMSNHGPVAWWWVYSNSEPSIEMVEFNKLLQVQPETVRSDSRYLMPKTITNGIETGRVTVQHVCCPKCHFLQRQRRCCGWCEAEHAPVYEMCSPFAEVGNNHPLVVEELLWLACACQGCATCMVFAWEVLNILEASREPSELELLMDGQQGVGPPCQQHESLRHALSFLPLAIDCWCEVSFALLFCREKGRSNTWLLPHCASGSADAWLIITGRNKVWDLHQQRGLTQH